MKRLMLIPFAVALFSLYITQASFSYFSDTETITAELAAAIPPSSVAVFYENATLTFLCHAPCCHHGGSSDVSEVGGVISTAKNDPSILEHAPQCFRRICSEAVLSGIYIDNKGRDVVLKGVVVKWWGGGRLNYLKIDNMTFNVNSTSPARIGIGVTLGGGIHTLELEFGSIVSAAFEITFVLNDHVEETYFVPSIEFKWV
ncbi:SipW-dependent-type signal peptide-containing protein [Thermococcus thioreducens]|uniref:SipW-cognate class signal peptide n=1 Tax=Thermococcus thioreducens TaxID=277988 RepID=A0A0Q2M1I2_9EURY|nr:SipW-dependent-type signal peptide-containing protein [Thermococcus thioreducens]KQH81905.1 hypothetical protein AMR53_09210 [Thermococcus thioreducens]SEW05966.1 SipW-cognate class signal peptide [Thermococcus thioreducens]